MSKRIKKKIIFLDIWYLKIFENLENDYPYPNPKIRISETADNFGSKIRILIFLSTPRFDLEWLGSLNMLWKLDCVIINWICTVRWGESNYGRGKQTMFEELTLFGQKHLNMLCHTTKIIHVIKSLIYQYIIYL